MVDSKVLLHVAPHPDDESVGAIATLLTFRNAGWRVVDLVVSLGRRSQRTLRRKEAEEAALRAGFELRISEPPFDISAEDDLLDSQRRLAASIAQTCLHTHAQVVVSPSPHDGHHGHEVVGRAVRDAISHGAATDTWWMWGLWGDLPFPTLYLPFDEEIMASALHVLEAHESQLVRSDYRRALRGRAAANAVLGAERVFGFGHAPRATSAYAELLTEVVWTGGRWMSGSPRTLTPASPTELAAGDDLTWWLLETSLADRRRRHLHPPHK